MMNLPKVKDFFPIVNGVASHINYDFQYITKEELDIIFISNYGQCTISPIASQLAVGDSPTEETLNSLGRMMVAIYGNKWDRYKNLYCLEYDAIHNFRDEFVETISENYNGSSNDSYSNEITSTHNQQDSNTRTDNTMQEITSTIDTNSNQVRTDELKETSSSNSSSLTSKSVDNDVFSFDSESASNLNNTNTSENDSEEYTSSKDNTGTQSNSLESLTTTNDTRSNTGTVSNELSSTLTNTSSREDARTHISNNTNERVRESVHSGNIGNLTTQQLIRQDIELWKWNFLYSVLADIKEFLTIPVYS